VEKGRRRTVTTYQENADVAAPAWAKLTLAEQLAAGPPDGAGPPSPPVHDSIQAVACWGARRWFVRAGGAPV
jgi:hypothetical protein